MKRSNRYFDINKQRNKPGYGSNETESLKMPDFKLSDLPEGSVVYSEMLDVLPIAVFIHTNGRFVYANQEAVRLHGFESASQLIGRSLVDFVHKDDLSSFQKNVFKYFETADKKRQSKLRIVQAKNIVLDLEVTSVPVIYQGKLARLAICLDTTENRKVEKKLFRYQDQLRALTSSMTLAEEYERHQIATNLHEQIGQALAVAKMKLGVVRQAVNTREMMHALDEIQELISQTIQSARSLTFELSPPVLHELGLKAALEWLVEKFAHQGTISYIYKDQSNSLELDGKIRVLLFRAARELLFNVAFHSNAAEAVLNLSEDKENVFIRVEDNGVGFDPAKIDEKVAELSGVGLFSIRERINHLGGSVGVESRIGEGTKVTIISPKKYHTE